MEVSFFPGIKETNFIVHYNIWDYSFSSISILTSPEHVVSIKIPKDYIWFRQQISAELIISKIVTVRHLHIADAIAIGQYSKSFRSKSGA